MYYSIAHVLALYKSYWAAMNKFFIYARPRVNKVFFFSWWCVELCFSSLFPKYPKIDGNDGKPSRFCLKFGFVLTIQNEQQKRSRCFANNRAWMISWKVCLKDWHLSGKRPEIGPRQKISSLYKVSSVTNVCVSFTKQVNYKVSLITKNCVLLFSPNNPTEAGKFLLQ